MEYITEDQVKKIALSCLKSFYKHYPRKGNTEAKLNQRGGNDIIADGYLSFAQEDDSVFTATFEATSLGKRNEVLFKVQRELLIWDSLSLASIAVTIFIAWQHVVVEHYWIAVYRIFNILVFLVASLGTLTFIFALPLSFLRRYRYIYAIEQFKRYFANDQWIAVSSNVFREQDTKYLEELQHQCVYNGFGLIMIKDDLSIDIKVAPSRVDLFDHKRKIIQFNDIGSITRSLPSPKLSPAFALVKKYLPIKAAQKYLPMPKSIVAFDPSKLKLSRFKRFYGNQVLVTLIGLVLTSAILFRSYIQEQPLIYLDEETYLAEMSKRRFEPFKYYGPDSINVVDTPYLHKPIPIDLNVKPYDPDKSQFNRPGLVIYSIDTGYSEYDCSRLFNLNKDQYLVEAGRFSSLSKAKYIIERLTKGGVTASILWMDCFQEGKEFMIFIGPLFDSFEKANRELSTIRRRLDQLNYVIPLGIHRLDI